MPATDGFKSSWADEVELDSGTLPPATETFDKNGNKVVTEYRINKDDKKEKVVRTYKITKQIVSKNIAKRKAWQKFGDSASDKPGPNPHTTLVSEDIHMQYVSNKEEDKNDASLETSKNQFAKCRFCGGEHFTVNCPFKHTASYIEKVQDKPQAPPVDQAPTKGKYVPPFMKDAQKAGTSGSRSGGRDDTAAIRISNLPESMVEADLEELVKKIGPQSKMYLARDKNTGMCKGFAYVHFKNRADAATAIDVLNGFGYDHLILNVEWSKPQN